MNIFRDILLYFRLVERKTVTGSLAPSGGVVSFKITRTSTNWLDRILAKMESSGLIGGATGWTGQIGVMPDDPDQLVILFPVREGVRDHTEGLRSDLREYMVRVRGSEFGYKAAAAKLRSIQTTMNNATVTGLAFNLVIGSPEAAGYDKNNRPLIEQRYRAVKEP